MSPFLWPKRMMVGRPLDSARLGETLLPKRLALPIFCSDPLYGIILLALAAIGLRTVAPPGLRPPPGAPSAPRL